MYRPVMTYPRVLHRHEQPHLLALPELLLRHAVLVLGAHDILCGQAPAATNGAIATAAAAGRGAAAVAVVRGAPGAAGRLGGRRRRQQPRRLSPTGQQRT